MADQVGWSTLSKIVLWTSVAFVILYIVMSGIYWRQYVAAKTVDPNGEIVSLWASFPLFTFLWSFVILGFVMFLLWRAHTTAVIFTAAAGVGTFLSQGYAERFGRDRDIYKKANTLDDAARQLKLARIASEKAIADDKTIKENASAAISEASSELDEAKQKYEKLSKTLSDKDKEISSVKQQIRSSLTSADKAGKGLELANLTTKKASILVSMRKAEDDVKSKIIKLSNTEEKQRRLLQYSNDTLSKTSQRLYLLTKEFERLFVGNSVVQPLVVASDDDV